MSVKTEDLESLRKIVKTLDRLKRKKKHDPKTIEKMLGCFAGLFPPDKSSVEIIQANRKKMFGA